jgi:hypothetical protein
MYQLRARCCRACDGQSDSPALAVQPDHGTQQGEIQGAAPEFGYSYNGVAKNRPHFQPKHSIYLRAFMGQGNQTAPVGTTDINPYFFEIGPIHVYNYSAGHNWSIYARLQQHITAGVNYFHQTFSDANTSFADVATAGFVTGAPFPNAPNIQIGSDFETTGNTPPEGRQDITGHLTRLSTGPRASISYAWAASSASAQVDEFYHRHAIGNFSSTAAQVPRAMVHCHGIPPITICASLADFLAGYLTKAPLQSATRNGSSIRRPSIFSPRIAIRLLPR